jgi:hypothetical protein
MNSKANVAGWLNPFLTHKMKTVSSSILLAAVASGSAAAPTAPATGNFGEAVTFLEKHTPVIVLSDPDGKAKVALAPNYQGRVMTSTANGDAGLSFGWINRELVASGQFLPHINVFGGEDRFWMGPEGGQFSIFFAKRVPFDLEHWFTPACMDTEPFSVVRQDLDKARFTRSMVLTNYSGVRFVVKVDREVRLLPANIGWQHLGCASVSDVQMVAFESINTIRNQGKSPWQKDTGLLSIWILGMFTPSPATTIVVPIRPGPESQLGKAVTADYFGPVPPSRLIVKDQVIYFSGDGKYRSKIGISPKRSKAILGSYDADNKVLTLVQFSQPAGVTEYVNSLWKLQDNPYSGDAANSYNDGPPSPGAKPMGPFYELESSSPAAALKPGKSTEHVHRTIHLQGPEKSLDPIARKMLGVGLEDIKNALPKAK